MAEGKFSCNVGNLREFLRWMYADDLPVRVKTPDGKDYEVSEITKLDSDVLIRLKTKGA